MSMEKPVDLKPDQKKEELPQTPKESGETALEKTKKVWTAESDRLNRPQQESSIVEKEENPQPKIEKVSQEVNAVPPVVHKEKKKITPPLPKPLAPLPTGKGFWESGGRFLLEAIPGIGDAVTFIEGVRGKESFGGRKLDKVDRAISFFVSFVPLLPATIYRDAVRTTRREIGYQFRKLKYNIHNAWRNYKNKDRVN